MGRARRRVHLSILALPVFTTLPGDRSLRLGDRLWLRCAARGSPTPRIGWTINDRPVTGLGLLGEGGCGPGTPGGGQTGGETQPRGEEKGVRVPGLQTWPRAGGAEQICVAVCDGLHVKSGKRPPAKKTQPRDLRAGRELVFLPGTAAPTVGPSANSFPWGAGSVLPAGPQLMFRETQGLHRAQGIW